MTPEIRIVVVTYNSANVVGDLIRSIPDAMGKISTEVVVVDNGSTDGTADLVAQLPGCRLIRSSNRGYSAGINTGVRLDGKPDAFLILNPDAILTPGFIEPMLRSLAIPGTGIVAPQIRDGDGRLEPSMRRVPTLARALGLTFTRLPVFCEFVLDTTAYERPQVVDWALGAVLLFSAECYDALGGWDESYFLYSEETDFSLRAKELGFLTRYTPDATAIHLAGGSGRDNNTHAMQIINRVRLFRRRNNRAASWLYFVLTIISELSWVARGHDQSRFAIRALLDPRRRPPVLGLSIRLMPE